jgi:hypothetical protein
MGSRMVKIAAAVVALVAVMVMVMVLTRPDVIDVMPTVDEDTPVPYNPKYPTTTVQAP